MRAQNMTRQSVLVNNLEFANSMVSRMIGLMGRKEFHKGSGLLIKRSGNSIHTFFMRFAIDLLFIDKKGEVKYLKKNVVPWKLVFAPLLRNTDCLELPAGVLEQSGTQIGDIIHVET